MANEYTEDFDLFLQDTLAELPGVIRSVAKRELRLTLREFFEKSYAWTKTVSGITIPQGVGGLIQVDDGDPNTEILTVLYVGINDGNGNVRDLTPLHGDQQFLQEAAAKLGALRPRCLRKRNEEG